MALGLHLLRQVYTRRRGLVLSHSLTQDVNVFMESGFLFVYLLLKSLVVDYNQVTGQLSRRLPVANVAEHVSDYLARLSKDGGLLRFACALIDVHVHRLPAIAASECCVRL